MTEEEAKTKWCPFARTTLAAKSAQDSSPPLNRVENAADGVEIWRSSCMGSVCMAFRHDGPGRVFCGLAGKP